MSASEADLLAAPSRKAGDTILLREVHDGRVWTARPGLVVGDRPDLLAVHIPLGTLWKVPVADRADMLERRKDGWTLTDHQWRRGPMLWLMPPGEAHAMHLWWHGHEWRFGGWYINLQDPIRRTSLGVDFLDQHLDVVIDPDFRWRWKDEDEFAAAVEIGLLSRQAGRGAARRGRACHPPARDARASLLRRLGALATGSKLAHSGTPRRLGGRRMIARAHELPFPAGSVVLITGIMGAGKSTIAQLLAERLPRAVHVRGDAFRRMIVSGRSEMVPSADAEALAQLQLRYDLAAQVADGYAEAGFTAVYQDIVLGDDLGRVPDRIGSRPLFVVVLAPTPDAVLGRAASRPKVSGYGEWTVEELDEQLRASPRIGLWLDTSDQTPEGTVDEVWRRAVEARIA